MLKDDEIKSIVNNSNISSKDKSFVIQRYIFDKKGQEINIPEPSGDISVRYTMINNRIITDDDLFNIMYFYAENFYKTI